MCEKSESSGGKRQTRARITNPQNEGEKTELKKTAKNMGIRISQKRQTKIQKRVKRDRKIKKRHTEMHADRQR